MALNRSDLRLAVTAGLTNAFATVSGLPFGIYAPLAVLAVCTGTFGNSRALGRQRLLGSLLGMAVLIVAFRGLEGVAFPLAIACALGSMRLLGGLLGLEVGYKVGGMIVVMGWLVHGGQLSTWLPLRLFWTTLGILVSVASLRLFWPARALPATHAALSHLLGDLATGLEAFARLVQPSAAAASPQVPAASAAPPSLPALRQQIQAVRQQLPVAFIELSANPAQHPQAQLLRLLCDSCSGLITALGGLERLAPRPESGPGDTTLRQGECELLASIAARLRQWQDCLASERGHLLPPPPLDPWQPPPRWQHLQSDVRELNPDPSALGRLRREASRLAFCAIAQRTLENGERRWRALSPDRRSR